MKQPLANDRDGIAFELPPTARKWRVQRATGKRGPQETLYVNGRPLEILIDTTPDQFESHIEDAGHPVAGFRFKLTAVDDHGNKVCETAAIIDFTQEEEEPSAKRLGLGHLELQPILSALSAAFATFSARDAELQRTLREGNNALIAVVSNALQAMVGRFGTMPPPAEHERAISPKPEAKEAPEDPEPSQAEVISQYVGLVPPLIGAIQAVRNAFAPTPDAPMPATPAFAPSGSNGVVHPQSTADEG